MTAEKLWLYDMDTPSGSIAQTQTSVHLTTNQLLFSPVACSTVTVDKCVAGLHMLRGFPFFQPTCLCKTPTKDPKCNRFKNLLFDHPCQKVERKGMKSFVFNV